MDNRTEEIHSKGFDLLDMSEKYRQVGSEFKNIKVGLKQLEDAILNLSSLDDNIRNCQYGKKSYVVQCLAEKNVTELQNISRFYYDYCGIYEAVCNYAANLYRYDWYIVPEVYDSDVEEEKVLKEFAKTLHYLDNSYIRKLSADLAKRTIIDGVYYGYVTDNKDSLVLQDLPIGYCRSRYKVGSKYAIEFNMKFFDTFSDINYRMRVLNLFPDEFAKGYKLYKQNKLQSDKMGENYGSWYLLDPNKTVKLSLNEKGIPMYVNAIPSIIDLDAAQNLDRRKQMQQLLKIIIQKLPLDKNGDLIFDVDEARDIHNNAVQMLRRAIGVDVLTTFADIESVNLSDKTTTTTTDELEKVERTVYNNLGVAQSLFNANGNVALSNSILNDESTFRDLLLQLNIFFDSVVRQKTASPKKYNFKFYMLETTQYNYRELSKLYKELTQIGFSKMLPQIALGHSQSSILNSIIFENNVLHLSEIMIPPLMSSTLSSEDILGENKSGRPETPDEQKSDKTIANESAIG